MLLKTFTIIGSGNVATHISKALQRQGYIINGVCSHTLANAEQLAAALHCPATDSIGDVPAADAFLFSVKDSALPSLSSEIVRRFGKTPTYIHTAGCIPVGIFGNGATRQAVIYPLQTLSKQREIDFRTVPLFIEATDSETLAAIKEVAETLSGTVREMSSENRRRLHLAAVFACNFVNHCYALGEKVVQEAGLDCSYLLPLVDETAAKAHTLSPRAVQTGPAVRWDENVMQAHLNLLEGNERMAEIYRLLSRSIKDFSAK